MKNLNEILFVTEKQPENKWFLSMGKPEFQSEEAFEISYEDAQRIMELL